MTIIKTLQPEQYPASSIVCHPSGNMPYTLVTVPVGYVEEHNLQEDVIEDTAAFFTGYDLSEGDESEA